MTALFDPNIDNGGNVKIKQDGLVEIISDYNERYEQEFTLASYAKFKKDIAARLANKDPYKKIERTPEKQIELLIVVDQMLTGFDSKWLNTLYMDKVLRYENIIQAFSRTNRLFGPDKPFGTICYYRYPHTMEQNINKAVELYSGNKPIGLFADKLEYNLGKMNEIYKDIAELFKNSGVVDFTKLPSDRSVCGKFASLYKNLNAYLEAAKIQGFKWSKLTYDIVDTDRSVDLIFDENIYLILALRYKELSNTGGGDGGDSSSIPFDISGHLTEIDTGSLMLSI